jgi:hypothetical protein
MPRIVEDECRIPPAGSIQPARLNYLVQTGNMAIPPELFFGRVNRVSYAVCLWFGLSGREFYDARKQMVFLLSSSPSSVPELQKS